jgi:endonuclease G
MKIRRHPAVPLATLDRRGISFWRILLLLWRLGRRSPGLALLGLGTAGGWYAYEVLYARPAMAYLGLPEAIRWDHPRTWTRVFRNHGFMVGYSELRGNPLWVIYALSPVPNHAPHLKRPSRFESDWRSLSHVGHADYGRSGYDRGHMAPNHAMSLLYGREGQLDSFLMTNITPQTKPLNEKVWERLEEAELDRLAPRFGKLWVVSGPVFDDHIERLPSSFRVEVPDAFYKIYAVPRPEGAPKLLAFIVPQTVKGKEPLDRFVTNVDQVELRTGLDFFPELDKNRAKAVEATIDTGFWQVREWAELRGRYDENSR